MPHDLSLISTIAAGFGLAFNPTIEIVVRTNSGEEAGLLESEQVARAFVGEHELATGMAAHVITRWQAAPH